MFLFFLFESQLALMDWWLNTSWPFFHQACGFSIDMWEPLWPIAVVLPFRWPVWRLSSFPTLTHNLSLCFFNVIVLFGPLFFSFHLLVFIPLFFYICIPMLPSCLPPPHPFCLSVVLSSPIFPPWWPAFYSAAPLTSAGIIPIMQSLCPDGQRDEFGFLQYKNSTWVDFVSKYLSVS